jgi:nuclease-like protein
MAIMFPRQFPYDLRLKPKFAGETLAFDVLKAELGDGWSVFYDRPVPGTRRRVDFLAVEPGYGVIAIEVKGGTVHAARGAFRQVIAPSGLRKRIDPFGQLKMAFARVCDGAQINALSLPVHLVIWFPHMGEAAFTWRPSPHIWTREASAVGAISDIVRRALSFPTTIEDSAALEKLKTVLTAGL